LALTLIITVNMHCLAQGLTDYQNSGKFKLLMIFRR